ncbi:MAG: hypothetical protein P1U40_12530 [Coxiellaceae bacterium]|nr:hypothetical protein [Coxiellaceae bacterium]
MLSYVVEQEFIAIKRESRYLDGGGAVHYHDSIGADITGMFEDPKVYSHLTFDQISDWLKIDDLAMLEFITADNLFNAVCEGILRRSVEKQGQNWLDMVNDPECTGKWFFGENFFFENKFAEKYSKVIELALVECADIVTRIFSEPAFQTLIDDADMLLSVLNYATVTPEEGPLAQILFANEDIRSLLVTPAQIEKAREYAPHAVDSFFDLPLAPEPAPARAPAVFEVSAASAADVVVSSSRLWHRRAGSDASASPSHEGYAPLAGSAKEAAAKASAKKKSSSGCCPNRCATM